MRRLVTAEEYIRDRIKLTDNGCWEWQGHRNGDGYAVTWFRRKYKRGHRFSYETFVGPIPERLELDHLCRNRCCVNPKHLEAVTHKENLLRGDSWGGKNSRKTHCPKGHPLSGENLQPQPTGRQCRTCANDASRRRSEKRRRAKGQRDLSKTCKNGHPRTPENTYIYPKSGNRTCKLCLQAKYLKPGGYKDPARERPSHCPQGHPYDEENTYVTPNGNYFYCRECNRQAARKKAA